MCVLGNYQCVAESVGPEYIASCILPTIQPMLVDRYVRSFYGPFIRSFSPYKISEYTSTARTYAYMYTSTIFIQKPYTHIFMYLSGGVGTLYFLVTSMFVLSPIY